MQNVQLNNAESKIHTDAPGFGGMIKKFWSKYIYNNFVDFYNKGKAAISGDENEELGNRMYQEFPEFHEDIDLMPNHDVSFEIAILQLIMLIDQIMNMNIAAANAYSKQP